MFEARMLWVFESQAIFILAFGIAVVAMFAWLSLPKEGKSGAPSYFQRKLREWKYLLYGRSMLQELAQSVTSNLQIALPFATDPLTGPRESIPGHKSCTQATGSILREAYGGSQCG